VILNLQGEAEEIIGRENLAHQIIEEFMIAVNRLWHDLWKRETSLSFTASTNLPVNLRGRIPEIHLPFRTAVKKESALFSREFQRVLLEVKDRPEEKTINNLLLRSMRWASIRQNQGHFGLASKATLILHPHPKIS
jgi:exoribonuclease R